MPQVVDVRALAVDDLAHYPLAHEVEHKHLRLAVAAVLKLHAVAAELLGRLDQLPALLYRECAWNLRDDVLACVHGVERNRNMEIPRRSIIDEIDVRIVAKLLPLLLRARIDLRLGLTLLLQQV